MLRSGGCAKNHGGEPGAMQHPHTDILQSPNSSLTTLLSSITSVMPHPPYLCWAKSGMQEPSSHTPASSPHPHPLPSSHTCQKKNMDSTNKQKSAECNRLWKWWRQVVRVTEKSRRWRAACWHGGSVGCVHREAQPHVTQSEWSHHHSFLSSSSHSFYNQPQQPVLR